MSIYATLWEMRYPIDGGSGWSDPTKRHMIQRVNLEAGQAFVDICAQCVPRHIDYTGPAWEWLPPPVDEFGEPNRAVFIICEGITEKGSARCGQEYVNPLLVLTGEEYLRVTWHDLWDRIGKALEKQLRAGKQPKVVRLPL